MKHLFYILFIFVFSAALQAQEVTITQSGGDVNISTQDSFLLLFHNEKTLAQSNTYDAFPSLAKGNGKILMKYVAASTHTTGQTIRVRKSVDDGKTWTDDTQVATGGYTGGSISHIGNDSFLLFYWKENVGSPFVDSTFWRLSTDGGTTWSSQTQLPNHPAFASFGYGTFVDGRAICNFGAAGTWYVPVWGSEATGYRAGVVRTTDYGSTWNYYFVRPASGTGDSEPELIVKGDSLVIYIRGQNTEKVYRSSSIDGEVWSSVIDVTPPAGNAPGRPGVIYCDDGTILLSGRSASDTLSLRYTYISQSFDGGFTFPVTQQIFLDGWYTYGDFAEIERGKYLYVGGVDTSDYTQSVIRQVTILFRHKMAFSGVERISGGANMFGENDLGNPGQTLKVSIDGNGTIWGDEESTIFSKSGSADASRTWNLGNYNHIWNLNGTGDFILQDNGTTAFNFTDAGSFFVGNPTGLTSAYKAAIKTSNNNASSYGLQINDSDNDMIFRVRDDGDVRSSNGLGSTFAILSPGANTSTGIISLGLSNTVSSGNVGIGNASISDGTLSSAFGWSARSRASQSTAIGAQVQVNSSGTNSFAGGTNIVNNVENSALLGISYSGALSNAKLTQSGDTGVGIGALSRHPILKINGENRSTSGSWLISGDTIITTTNHNVTSGNLVALIDSTLSNIYYANVLSVLTTNRFIIDSIPPVAGGIAVYFNDANYLSIQDGGNLNFLFRVSAKGGANVGDGNFTDAAGVINAQTGFRINDSAPDSTILGGNNTNYIARGTYWIRGKLNPYFFEQGGNSFDTTAFLGTADAQPLAFLTNNTPRRTYDASGNVTENLADFTGTYTDDFRLGVNDTILMNANNGVAILRTTNNIFEIEDDSTMIDQEVFLRDYGSGTTITGTALHDAQIDADGKIIPVTLTDTVYLTITPLALTDSLKTVANLANDSWTVPSELNGYKIAKIQYAVFQAGSGTGSTVVGLRRYSSTRSVGYSNGYSADFAAGDLNEAITGSSTLVTGDLYVFHVNSHSMVTAATGLTATVMLTK